MQIDHIPPLKRAGRNFVGDCPSCGYKNALSVSIKEGKQLFYCHAGCAQQDLINALRDKAGLKSPAPQPIQKIRDLSDFVQKLWEQSAPAQGTIVEKYLSSRAINLVPSSIRYLHNHPHKPSGRSFPVMLAAAQDIEGNVRALHRTFLRIDGQGKAEVTPAKMILGPVKGLAAHLAPTTDELVITEGIETGLSVMVATGKPVWSALSAGGIQNLILPALPLASEITIAADADPVGLRAASIAAQRFREEGRKVKVATPPQGMDFNDILRSAAV